VPAESGTTRRYVLPRKLRSASWAVVAIDHHYPTRQNHWVIPCRSEHLIAVHEEAGDGGAHEQLIADRFCLRYRDTSLSRSSEKTQNLPKTESWASAWLRSFFRPTSELLRDVVDEDGRAACSVRNGRDGLVAIGQG
jgi:hypothetical protein